MANDEDENDEDEDDDDDVDENDDKKKQKLRNYLYCNWQKDCYRYRQILIVVMSIVPGANLNVIRKKKE